MRNVADVPQVFATFACLLTISWHAQVTRVFGFGETSLQLIESGVEFLRKGFELFTEDPVEFAHRVYGSTVSFTSGSFTENRFRIIELLFEGPDHCVSPVSELRTWSRNWSSTNSSTGERRYIANFQTQNVTGHGGRYHFKEEFQTKSSQNST